MPVKNIAIVTPVYNEQDVIASFHERLTMVLDTLSQYRFSVVYVVDRCTDNSLAILKEIAGRDRRVMVLAMSSRFGHQMSLLAGIEQARTSDAIVMMDSDLQHPPELIPTLIAHWDSGNDVVFTVRNETDGVNALRKHAGNLFYFILNWISDSPINPNAADFRLISQRVAHVLCDEIHERSLFLRGVFGWMGFRQIAVSFSAEKRGGGSSKYSLSRILKLAVAGVLSSSTKPLQIGLFLGICLAAFAFLLMAFTVINFFIDRSLPSGWTTVVTILLLFSGVQLIVLGVMGAYIGGIYEEVKRRPRYIIDERVSHHE